MKKIILAFIFMYSCQSENHPKKNIPPKDTSYELFNKMQKEQQLSFSSYFNNKAHEILLDNLAIDSIGRDTLPLDTIFHQFRQREFINRDYKAGLSITDYIYTKEYYKTHKFKPTFLSLRFYSDNLIGLNLASELKGNMMASVYDKKTGHQLATYNKSAFDGSFYLGSASKYDTFTDIRLVLAIDTFLYEQSFKKEEIVDN